jgi:predicted ATP-dependent serine protease
LGELRAREPWEDLESMSDGEFDGSGRVSTGIPGLDGVLDGGLPAHQTFLVQGEPGAGKTTLEPLLAVERQAAEARHD